MLHVKNMTAEPLMPLIKAGYNVSVRQFDMEAVLSMLLEIPNIGINESNAREFTKLIPVYSKTEFWYPNQSNLLRLALIYLYGGVYLNTDMIVMRPLDELRNVLGREDKYRQYINVAALKFDKGKRFIASCLDNFFGNFKPEIWGYSGPQLVTQVWKQGNFSEMDVCVMKHTAFYPSHWMDVKHLCMEKRGPKKLKRIKCRIQTESFAVHDGNKITKGSLVEEGSVCEWLYNSFCVVSNCTKSQKAEQQKKI
jgi:hypothetical protein